MSKGDEKPGQVRYDMHLFVHFTMKYRLFVIILLTMILGRIVQGDWASSAVVALALLIAFLWRANRPEYSCYRDSHERYDQPYMSYSDFKYEMTEGDAFGMTDKQRHCRLCAYEFFLNMVLDQQLRDAVAESPDDERVFNLVSTVLNLDPADTGQNAHEATSRRPPRRQPISEVELLKLLETTTLEAGSGAGHLYVD